MSEKQDKKERSIKEELADERIEIVISIRPTGNMEIKCSRNLPRKVQSDLIHQAYTVMERAIMVDEVKNTLFKANTPQGFINLQTGNARS